MNLEQARFNMVEQQVRPWSVLDQTVLDIMETLPRDAFVPESLKSLAYADIEIPLGHGESMMFPRVEGRLLQELSLDETDECLEIGTGSGYLTGCLAQLSRQVHSIDIYDDFLQKAGEILASLNISNVHLENLDAMQQLPGKRYDAVAVTGSIPEYMPELEQLLKPGGRLFVVVGHHQIMHATKVVREENGKISRTNLFETALKPLVGAEQPPAFSF